MNYNKKIFVAGHQGLVGSAIVRCLKQKGYGNLLLKTKAELNLLEQKAVNGFLSKEIPDYIIIAAARVGGILANNKYRADFIYENLMIAANLIHGAWLAGVNDLLFLGSSCIYPKFAPQPMKEEYLLTGELEYTNEPYAIAKIAGIKLCESYNLQHGTNYLTAMPTNLYGLNDNFDLERSHVLPALIRKFHLGKCLLEGNWSAVCKDLDNNPVEGISGSASRSEILTILDKYGVSLDDCRKPVVTIWGTGTPRREFLHSDDLADACVFLMENLSFSDMYDSGASEIRNTHINIGTGEDITIRDLATLIQGIVGFEGGVRFDASKPDGTLRKLQDVSKLRAMGWKHNISLQKGIKGLYENIVLPEESKTDKLSHV